MVKEFLEKLNKLCNEYGVALESWGSEILIAPAKDVPINELKLEANNWGYLIPTIGGKRVDD